MEGSKLRKRSLAVTNDLGAKVKRIKSFSAKVFRQEMKKDVISSLKDFLRFSQQDDYKHIPLEYLESGGSIQELLMLLDQSAKTDLTSAVPVFKILYLILLEIRDSDSKFYAQAEHDVKYMLNSFSPTIMAMMNINNNKYRKAVLKVLTSLVILFPHFAKEFLHFIPLSSVKTHEFLQPVASNDSVRKWFILFILSFIIGGDNGTIQSLLSTKGLISDIIMDLKFDEANTVNMVLSVLKENVLEKSCVTKTLKLKIFNTQALIALFDLYNWKGPKNIVINSAMKKRGIKEREVNAEDKQLVVESVHAFLLILCTSKKFGVVFSDNTFGSSGEIKNNLLFSVIQSLSEPWEKEKIAEIIIKIVASCPDLFKITLSRMETAFKPRESKKWIDLMRFTENLLEAISPVNILKVAAEVSGVDLVRLSKDFCTPTVLMRNMRIGIRDITSLSVIYYSMKILTLIWKKAEEVLHSFEKHPRIIKSLILSFSNCVFDIDDILILWRKVCESQSKLTDYSIRNEVFLNVILDFLYMSSKCNKDIDSPVCIIEEMLQILDDCKETLSEAGFTSIRNKIFRLFTSIDPLSITPDNDLFVQAITSLLQNNNNDAYESVSKMVISTGIFDSNESEIHVWLTCYFNNLQEYKNCIPTFFADCIRCFCLKEIDFEQNFIDDSSKKDFIFTGNYFNLKSSEKTEISQVILQAQSQNIEIELMNLQTAELIKEKWIDVTTESPSLMLIQSLELLKASSEGKRRKKKLKEVQHYVNQVAFRLFQFNNNSPTILQICENYQNYVGSVLNCLYKWQKTEFTENFNFFLTIAEKDLMTWILYEENEMNLEKIDKTEESVLTSFLTFKMVTSYLITKVQNNSLDNNDFSKLSQIFSFFLRKLIPKIEISNNTLVKNPSWSDLNLSNFRKKCLHYFFKIPIVHKFDVYNYKNKTIMNFTKLIVSIIMNIEKNEMKNLIELAAWKKIVLNGIKTNIEDRGKTSKILKNVESLLNCLYFTSTEVAEILDEYGKISDMSCFVAENHLTVAAIVFMKFVQLQCEYSEINEKVVNLLWNIMECMIEKKISDFEIFDNCLVYVLKKRPKTLNLIQDGFINGVLERLDDNPHAFTFGRLLLNDPAKASYFLNYAINNFKVLKNENAFISMLSALIQKENRFLEMLKLHNYCTYWKHNEIFGDSECDMKTLMKLVFERYKDSLVLNNSKRKFIMQYSDFFALLLRCFLEKELLMDRLENIARGLFMPEIFHKTILKFPEEIILKSYVNGLLKIFKVTLKETEHGVCEEFVWSKYSIYIYDLVNLEKDFKWNTIIDSKLWKDFVRISLRVAFSFPNCASLLKTIRYLIELLYMSEENNSDIRIIFEMVISHSLFLEVMLQQSLVKNELVKLYYFLVRKNISLLSAKHVPVILASYSASLSECDSVLLRILKFYESCNINMSEYQPLIWGESAINHYSIKSNIGVSLWRRVNMLTVLDLLDIGRLEISIKNFPVGKVQFNNAETYDPEFLLPLFSTLLSPGAITFCLPFVQKGCFAYTICSLSSVDKEIRLNGSLVLARFYKHLELVQNMKMKPVWLHFINCLRYGIEDIKSKPLPSLVTFFLAKMSMELSDDPGDMYISLQKFLLAKPVFNFNCIPEFLPLFHSSDIQYLNQRRWILEILRDGFKQNLDFDIFFQTMALKMILSYFASNFSSRDSKLLVLEVLTKAMSFGKATLLITEYGLLTWIYGTCLDCDKELFFPLLKLIFSVTNRLGMIFVKDIQKKSNLFYSVQVLNILMKILPNLSKYYSIEALEMFLRILLTCLIKLFKHKETDWCKLNSKNLCVISNIVIKAVNDENLPEKYKHLKFFFHLGNETSDLEILFQKIMLLWQSLIDFSL